MSYSRVLAQIESKLPVDPAAVAVLFCPPLDWSHVLADMQSESRAKDFVKRNLLGVARPFHDFVAYERDFAFPVLNEFDQIRRTTRASCFINATLQTFRNMVEGQFQVAFLVAHHPESPAGPPSIEFADRIWQWTDVEKILENKVGKLSLALAVCSMSSAATDYRSREWRQGPISFASWKVPLAGGLRIARMIIQNLDGKKTFSQAYGQVIKEEIDGSESAVGAP